MTDAKEIEKQVNDSIRENLRTGQLDITVAAATASCVEGDKGEGEEDEYQDQEGDIKLSSDEDSTTLPKVAVWYRNAVMKNLWENASPSQRDKVEQYKKKVEDKEEMGDNSNNEMGDDDYAQHKVNRLQKVIKFMIPDFVTVTLKLTSPNIV
jgi:hypothetical protein